MAPVTAAMAAAVGTTPDGASTAQAASIIRPAQRAFRVLPASDEAPLLAATWDRIVTIVFTIRNTPMSDAGTDVRSTIHSGTTTVSSDRWMDITQVRPVVIRNGKSRSARRESREARCPDLPPGSRRTTAHAARNDRALPAGRA